MAEVNRIISDSIKNTSFKGFSVTCEDVPELAKIGIGVLGEAEQGTPYEMLRTGGGEKQHVTLWFMLEGSMRFETGNKIYTGEPGTFLVQNSALDRRCAMETGLFRSIYFMLPGANMAPGVFQASHLHELRAVIGMLRRECLEGSETSARTVLLVQLLDSYLQKELSRGPSFSCLQKAVTLVENNMHLPWSTSKLARKLNISNALLYQKCMLQYGCAPKVLIARIKFQYAKYLLCNTDMKLTEIAAKLGYRTAYAFSKAFLKHTGARPGATRKMIEEIQAKKWGE